MKTLYHGDNNDVLRELVDEGVQVDSVVTDPPYGLSFMNKKWDYDVPTVEFWKLVLEILKPGGHVLSFGGTRTYHRMVCNIEDAGFEIRDQIVWLYGTGFPKSLDVSKAIDKRRATNDLIRPWLESLGTREEIANATGVTPRQVDHWMGNNKTPCPQTLTEKRFIKLCEFFNTVPEWADEMYESIGEKIGSVTHSRSGGDDFAKIPGSSSKTKTVDLHAPETNGAVKWQGWGTALKPAVEPIVLARKPLGEHTVAANVIKFTTGAINIDDCRIHTSGSEAKEYTIKRFSPGASINKNGEWKQEVDFSSVTKAGRFPANVILAHTENCVEIGLRKLKPKEGHRPNPVAQQADGNIQFTQKPAGYQKISYTGSDGMEEVETWECASDCPVRLLDEQSGERPGCKSPSAAKPESKFRPGQGNYQRQGPIYPGGGGASRFFYSAKASKKERRGSKHPTVKPLVLMRYLCRLITPSGGTLLDPFAGSGTTGEAALLEGFTPVLIERDADYIKDIETRLADTRTATLDLFEDDAA